MIYAELAPMDVSSTMIRVKMSEMHKLATKEEKKKLMQSLIDQNILSELVVDYMIEHEDGLYIENGIEFKKKKDGERRQEEKKKKEESKREKKGRRVLKLFGKSKDKKANSNN